MAPLTEGASALPRSAEVVIIGGGIIGVSAALFLARAGMRPLLLEKGRIAGEQSGRNWGWVRRMGRDPLELPLARRALDLWDRFTREGLDTGFVRCGIAYLCPTPAEMARRLAWFERHAGEAGGDIRVLSAREVTARFSQLARPMAGALLSPHDGRAEPERATRALAEAARDAGALIMESCAGGGIETAGGQVTGVITERGRVATSRVIVAGGIWSRLLLERAGIVIPQVAVINSVATLSPVPGLPETSVGAGAYAFRLCDNGEIILAHGRISQVPITRQHLRFLPKYLAGWVREWRDLPPWPGLLDASWAAPAVRGEMDPAPFVRQRIADPPVSLRILRRALRAASRDFPALADARMQRLHAGLIDVLPDAVPVIDVPASPSGLVIATGFSGHGFGIGPAAGELAADLALGRRPMVDPAPFRLSRLT